MYPIYPIYTIKVLADSLFDFRSSCGNPLCSHSNLISKNKIKIKIIEIYGCMPCMVILNMFKSKNKIK